VEVNLLHAIGGRSTMGLVATALAIALSAGVAGCGADSPDGSERVASADGAAPVGSLHGDMMTPVRGEAIAAAPALGAVSAEHAFSSGGSGTIQPKVIYLVYADGTQLPPTAYNACTGTAPKFNCTFAPTLEECQRQIQSYLDRWYADFNVIFTLTRPTSGSYYTEVVSSGGGTWCGVSSSVAGVAPFLCQDLHGGVAYTLDGGDSAHDTAVIIAQEQAHLVGLEHVSDTNDIMYPYICQTCDGFENVAVPVTADRCDRQTQNSYQMMLTGLGAWGGGPKPSVFGCIDDTQAPTVAFVSPANGASMGHDFSVKVNAHDDCDLAEVAISVSPQGLTATAKTGPYEWDLTGIDGAQTITVTATDGSGHATVATLNVLAPAASEVAASTATPASGCTVVSGAFGAVGLLPSLAILLVFGGRGRRASRRRRLVTGALATSER
jgi:Big-like domain-containing protein